jgi:hypothetical protein
MIPGLDLRIAGGIFGILAQLAAYTGELGDVFAYHQNKSVHKDASFDFSIIIRIFLPQRNPGKKKDVDISTISLYGKCCNFNK